MNPLAIITTLGELAAALNTGGSGPGLIDQVNAFAETEQGRRVIGLFDQLLEEMGCKLVVGVRK